jgi:hypothetical protein
MNARQETTAAPVGSECCVTRRSFIRFAAGAAITAGPWHNLYGSADDYAASAQADGRLALPVHAPTEVLIGGSTLFACDLALRSARAGKMTTLVMDRANPCFENITCLRSWVAADRIPDLLHAVATNPDTSELKGNRLYLNASQAALDIEDQLCEAGVRFLYNAAVAGALGRGERLAGVVFGGKTGLFAIQAGVIVDATPDATVARAAGAKTTPQPGPRRYHYVVDLAAPVPARQLDYTASNGARVSVDIHHYYACFDIELDSSSGGPFALNNDYAAVYSATLECPWEGDEKRFRGADGFLCSGVDRITAPHGRVAGLDNLLVFGPQGIPGNSMGSLVLKSPAALFDAFPNALQQLAAATLPVASDRAYEFWNRALPAESPEPTDLVHGFTDHGFDEPGTVIGEVSFHPPQPAFHTEVLVAGGGTSGNAAAFTSAGLGMRTTCLEQGLELGGTNTLGGVTKLWFGNRTQGFKDYYSAMGAKDDGLNAPGFFQGITQAGCNVILQAAVTGVARAGRAIRRVYVTTPMGLACIGAAHVIDATGDGSLAAWGGCGYTFGGIHDETTLWGSFGVFSPGRQEARRQFLSPCDERSPVDTSRFIIAMRRHSAGGMRGGDFISRQKHAPPSFFLAPRESRHIRCGKTVTYLDTLAGRRFRDGILRAVANHDIKGIGTSDAIKAGFVHTNRLACFEVTIPYAALIPTALDNIIIAGKAYSATHDALALARMQSDLCAMGIAAAEAVHVAAVSDVLLRDIPIRKLQAVLVARQILKRDDIAEDDFGFPAPAHELAERVAASTTPDAALAESAMLCLVPREQALAALAPHTASTNPAVQRLLCFLSVPAGVAAYLAEARAALDAEHLDKVLCGATTHPMPDHGFAPRPALLLSCLAQARAPEATALLVKLADRMGAETGDINSDWGYLFTLACGFERLACAEGIAPLNEVLTLPILQHRIISRRDDLRKTADYLGERYAYLRMALARALTRCGSADGALALCDLLDESRVCLARAARAELAAATGQDLGFAADQWRIWIHQHGQTLKPNPLTVPFA